MAKINTIWVLLSLAVNLDWPLQQLDVKNAFLNDDLEKEVYMELPPDFDLERKNGKVCRLKKSLYGLSNHHVPGSTDSPKLFNNMAINKHMHIIHYSIDL